MVMKEITAGFLMLVMMVSFVFACFGYTWCGWVGFTAMLVGTFLFDRKENK